MSNDLSLVTILQVAGFGGVVAAIVNQGLKWLFEIVGERRKRDVEAGYLAMRVVVILERFVSECESHLSDRRLAHDVGNMENSGKLPTLADFPTDIDWRHFDQSLAFAVLGLPSMIEAAQNECHRAYWEANDTWRSFEEAVKLALLGWHIASDIRDRYALGENRGLQFVVGNLKRERARQEVAEARLQAELVATLDRKNNSGENKSTQNA